MDEPNQQEAPAAATPPKVIPPQRRTVLQMADLVIRVVLKRRRAVIVASLPVWLITVVPKVAGGWIDFKWMRFSLRELFEMIRVGDMDVGAVQELMERIDPVSNVAIVRRLLGGTSLLSSIVAGPLWHGALTLLVIAFAVGEPLGARAAWRGSMRRGFHLVLTEGVKFFLFLLVIVIGTIMGGLVSVAGGVVLNLVLPSGSLATFLTILWSVSAGALFALGPFCYLYLLLIFTVPLVLFEKLDVVRAFKRSAQIVRTQVAGGFWRSHPMRLTGLLSLAVLILWIASLPAAAPWIVWFTKGFKHLLGEDPETFFHVPGSLVVVSTLLLVFPQVILSPVFPGMIAAYYLDARSRSEEGSAESVSGYLASLCFGGGALPDARLAPATPPSGAEPVPASPLPLLEGGEGGTGGEGLPQA